MLRSPTTTLYDLSERGKCQVRKKVRQNPKAFCQCTQRRVYSTSQDGVTFPSTLLSIPQPYRRNSYPHGRGRFAPPSHVITWPIWTHFSTYLPVSARNRSDKRHTLCTGTSQNCCVSKSVALLFRCVWWIHLVNIYWCERVIWLFGYWSISDQAFLMYTVRYQHPCNK